MSEETTKTTADAAVEQPKEELNETELENVTGGSKFTLGNAPRVSQPKTTGQA